MRADGDERSDHALEIGHQCVDPIDLIQKRADPQPVKLRNRHGKRGIALDHLLEPCTPSGAEQVRELLMNKVAMQNRMDHVLALGPSSHERCAITGELPETFGVLVRKRDLGQVVNACQLGQNACIDTIRFDPCLGARD